MRSKLSRLSANSFLGLPPKDGMRIKTNMAFPAEPIVSDSQPHCQDDSSFPPSARRLLALPWKRVFFAGEHTSTIWQGYMNGAVESGLRAAEEVFATIKLSNGL
jgi:hypothetical protein